MQEKDEIVPNKENNYNSYLISVRVPNEFKQRIDDYLELHPQKLSHFVKRAIEEKLARKAIEENLEVKAESTELNNAIVSFKDQMNTEITTVKNLYNSLKSDMSSQLSDIKTLLMNLQKNIDLSAAKTPILKDELEEKILGLLPSNKNDLYDSLDDYELDRINHTLSKLQAEKKITKSDNIWRSI